MQSILFGFVFLLLNLVLIGAAIACTVAMYRTFWHVVEVFKRKEQLSFDWNMFVILCCGFLLLTILVIWPMAIFAVWRSTYQL